MGVERVFIAVKSGLCIGGVSLFSPGDKVSGVLEVVTTSEGEELEGDGVFPSTCFTWE